MSFTDWAGMSCNVAQSTFACLNHLKLSCSSLSMFADVVFDWWRHYENVCQPRSEYSRNATKWVTRVVVSSRPKRRSLCPRSNESKLMPSPNHLFRYICIEIANWPCLPSHKALHFQHTTYRRSLSLPVVALATVWLLRSSFCFIEFLATFGSPVLVPILLLSSSTTSLCFEFEQLVLLIVDL